MKLEPGDLQDADLKEGMRVIYRMVRLLAATPGAWKRKAKHTSTHTYHPFFKKRGSKVTTAILAGDKEEEQS